MSALPEEVRVLFAGANVAHVATLTRDGSPSSVPMWVDVEGDRIAFLSSLASAKGRNLQRDPRVSISVTDAERPTSMAQVRGRVSEILDGDPAWAIIDRIAGKYIGAPYPLRSDRVIFLVAVEQAWARAFG